MKSFLKKFFKKIQLDKIFFHLSYRPKLIQLEKLRCQKGREYSDNIGFGGKKIELFPPYEILKLYLTEPIEARKKFFEFLHYHFLEKKAWKISKKKGGMFKGSLYKSIEQLLSGEEIIINETLLLNNRILVEKAINKRINHYFNVFDSIKKNGFKPELQPIKAETDNKLYYLLNGHHRIAILSILGYKKAVIYKRTKIARLFKK